MTKIIKEPVYREVLECENCKTRWAKDGKWYYNAAKFCKCWVCKKEGCANCSSWMNPTEKEKYHYHNKCKEGLPKTVLKAMQKIKDKWDAQERWSEYINRR